MVSQTVAKTIYLSPQEEKALREMSREEHVSEAVLLKKLVLESLARRRLEWACAAYARGEIDLSSAARYANVSIYEMMDELRRRGIEMVSVEQFLDDLENLAELFELPALREVAIELREQPVPTAEDSFPEVTG